MISRWMPSIRRTLLGVAPYIVAIIIHTASPNETVSVYIVAGVIALGLILLDEYLTAVRPAKQLQDLAPIALDGLVDSLISQLGNSGVIVRANLMIVTRTWRWCRLRRYFRTKWHRGMQNQPDVNLIFHISKGISGQCLQSKRPIYAGPQALSEHPLPARTGVFTQHLQAVLSFPVFEPPRRDGMQSGKVLGV